MSYKVVKEEELEYVLNMLKKGDTPEDIANKTSYFDLKRVKYITKRLVELGRIEKSEINRTTDAEKKRQEEEEYVLRLLKQGYTYKEIEADSQIGEEDGEEREGIKLARIKYIKSKLVADGKITEEEIEKILKKQQEATKREQEKIYAQKRRKMQQDKEEKLKIKELESKIEKGTYRGKRAKVQNAKLIEMKRKYLYRMAKEEYDRELDGGSQRIVTDRIDFFNFLIENKDNQNLKINQNEANLLKESLKYNKHVLNERYIKYLILQTYDHNTKNLCKVEQLVNELQESIEDDRCKNLLEKYYVYIRAEERKIEEESKIEETKKFKEKNSNIQNVEKIEEKESEESIKE